VVVQNSDPPLTIYDNNLNESVVKVWPEPAMHPNISGSDDFV
jgi:hypothetical protein